MGTLKLFFAVALAFTATAQAGNNRIDCIADGKAIDVNNQQVLKWKTSTKNSYQDRARVEGPIVRLYADKNGHEHFSISIGKAATDTIEIIYNHDFGAIPNLRVGDTVEACGDYITSFARSGPYPPSPDGAIVHWVHGAPDLGKHPHGYVMVNGALYGQDIENAGPKRFRK